MTITKDDLAQARQDWGNGLVAISKAYEAGGIDSARAEARKVLDSVYGYNLGPVLFKPTMAGGEQTFRPTYEGALSYSDDEVIKLNWKAREPKPVGKGKVTVNKEVELNYNQIQLIQ